LSNTVESTIREIAEDVYSSLGSCASFEYGNEPLPPQPHCDCGCARFDPNEVVGWCLRCTHVYKVYSPAIENQHFAHHCPEAPEQLKESARARLAKPNRSTLHQESKKGDKANGHHQ
jgi:hypothetical protein